MNGNKFTVIIPTRERADTLQYCLKTIVAQTYQNLTILVSDNCSQDNTKEIVESFDDPRIKYVNTGKRLSMTGNFEFSLGLVKEGWVTFVGDDDGLLPGALEKIDALIDETEAEAIISNWCLFNWPIIGSNNKNLVLSTKTGWAWRDSTKWLAKVMNGNATYNELPMLYTGGFISISAINKVKDEEGVFYKSRTPDSYSSISIASVLERYVVCYDAVSIAGVSKNSNGASQLGLNKEKRASDLYFSEPNIPFHPDLGDGTVKSIPLIVYEAYLRSSHNHKNFLDIQLIDQLALALALTTDTKNDTSVRAYVKGLAKQHTILMTDIERVEHKIRRQHKLKKIFILARKYMTQDHINTRKFNVWDVYDASIFCAYYYHSQKFSNTRWLRKLTELPETIFHFLGRAK